MDSPAEFLLRLERGGQELIGSGSMEGEGEGSQINIDMVGD